MATVELIDVRKSFSGTEVIHGIDAQIEDGEFIVIVGPSGCGKSTLLRLVAGLETISQGEVHINGSRVNDLEPMDRDIAMVFQNYALYPHMSVRQNMAYSLKIAGVSRPEINKKVEEAAELLELQDYLNRKPKQLSGGQRQRVAMGRAIVREPSVFLFDEPLSNLDAKLRVQMRLEIKELQTRLGITSLYVTHDQVEAMTMADRMIVMNEGVAEQIGTPLEVYQKPHTLFAAQFIGSPSMNAFDATVKGGEAVLESGVRIRCNCSFEGEAVIGLRPEHLIADENGPLRVNIHLAEPLGANTLLHGRLSQSRDPVIVSMAGVHSALGTEQNMRVSISPDNVHVFDKATSQRVASLKA